MHDRSQPEDPSTQTHRTKTGGIGFALFLVLTGLVLLSERLG